ncbi:hypothetical protein, partial [Sinomicrobium weinanense]
MSSSSSIMIIPPKRKRPVFSGILLLLITSIVLLIENNIAVFIVTGLWFLLGVLLIKISFPRVNRHESYRLWLLFFTIYYLYMIITNYVYVRDPNSDFFFHFDSLDFYTVTDSLIRQKVNLEMFDWEFYRIKNYPGFAFLSWLLGRIANMMGEVNSIVLQKTQIVFTCAMTIIFLYNIGRLYLPHKRTWIIAVTFGLLTHIFAFSGTYTRDPHILLFFVIGFYIFMSEWKFRNLILLVLVGFLVAQFRMQHGLFFIAFISAYLFVRIKKFKNKIASFLLGIVFIMGFVASIVFNF